MKLSICIQYKYHFKNDTAPYTSVRLTVIMMTSDDDDKCIAYLAMVLTKQTYKPKKPPKQTLITFILVHD